VRQSLLTVTMLVAVWVAWMLRDLVMLVGFAALLAYALDPVVSWMERLALPGRRRVPHGVAAGLVVVLLVLVVGASLAASVPRLVQQMAGFASTAPETLARLEQNARAFLQAHGGKAFATGAGSANDATTSLLATLQRASTPLLGRVAGSLGGLAGVVLVPLFAVYMLADRDRARSAVLGFVPAERVPRAERLLDALDRALHAYVRGQALVCLAMGSAMAIVLTVLGVPVALLLGVVVGLAEIIPILGFWLAAAAIVLEGYSKTPGLALTGLAAYMVVNYLMGTFVSPRLLGRQVKLHPFVVNVSVIGGGMLLGPGGAILALPAAAMAKSLLDEFGPRAMERPRAA